MNKALCAGLVLLLALPAQARDLDPYQSAVLRLLDKATARVEEREVNVGEATQFGPLHIMIKACRQAPPIERPEAAAFMEISEFKPGTKETLAFRGWMFASNPALSALEHPIYDVWLTSCKKPVNNPEGMIQPEVPAMPAALGAAPAAAPAEPAVAPKPTPKVSPIIKPLEEAPDIEEEEPTGEEERGEEDETEEEPEESPR